MLLKDKIAIVTGAAQGIGKAIARIFSEHGSITILLDVQKDKVEISAREIEKLTGNKAIGLAADITKKHQVENAIKYVVDMFGRIDILVNNAGIIKHALIVDMDERDWDRIFEVNVKGTFLMTQAVAKIMMKQKKGR